MKVAIVGGGIAGLGTAWHLLQAGHSPLVLEATGFVGGLVRTLDWEGRRIELGADTLVTQKPAAVALCRRIGLGGELRFQEARATATRVLRDGRTFAIPEGTNLLAPARWVPLLRSRLLSWRGIARLALEPAIRAQRDPEHDESLASFIHRRFGREVLDAFAEPVLASLFLADAERVSMRLTMPRLLEAERVHGSVRRALARAAPDGEARTGRPHAGSGGFATLRGGLGTLPQRLASLLPREGLRLHARVQGIGKGDRHFVLRLGNGERVVADGVVLACPAQEAGRLVSGLDADLAGELAGLEYASCATVHLLYRREDVGAKLQGHGFFVPRTEGVPFLACSYVSEKYPERALPGDVLLRAFIGGARAPRALEREDDFILARTHRALAPILDLRAHPHLSHVQRHVRAMPHFRVGDAARLARIQALAMNRGAIVVAGGVRGAVGIPDVVASARAAADEMTALLARQPAPEEAAAQAQAQAQVAAAE